ncbi:hypothetical protein [Kangiella sp.]|uniref:hypothetical protein n=1 Tax=Kangiella sp. TaxID=1920245 RepID=UPI003A945523
MKERVEKKERGILTSLIVFMVLLVILLVTHSYLWANCQPYKGFINTHIVLPGTSTFINSTLVSMVGAFAGAWIAFQIQNYRDKKKEFNTKKILAAELYYNYMDTLRFVAGYRNEFINKDNIEDKDLFMLAYRPGMSPRSELFSINGETIKFLSSEPSLHNTLKDISVSKDLFGQFKYTLDNFHEFYFGEYRDTSVRITQYINKCRAGSKPCNSKDILNPDVIEIKYWTMLTGYVKNIEQSNLLIFNHLKGSVMTLEKEFKSYFKSELPVLISNSPFNKNH